MTKIYYDCEFLEDGERIHLISIGMVAEDGREFYGVNREMPHKRIAKHDWLMANVVPSLPRIHGDRRLQVSYRRNPLALDFDHPAMMSRSRIAAEVERFIGSTPEPQLWAWYGAYDHIALCPHRWQPAPTGNAAMTGMRRTQPPAHRCQTPSTPGPDPTLPTLFSRPIGRFGDLWRCDDCGKLWRIGEACDWCDHYGPRPHAGGHEVGERWRPATLWQRIRHRHPA